MQRRQIVVEDLRVMSFDHARDTPHQCDWFIAIGDPKEREAVAQRVTSSRNDVKTDNFATIAQGVHVAGNAEIGIGASIKNGRPGKPLRIGSECVIGAGACASPHPQRLR